MKYTQFTKQFAGILMGTVLFAACKKVDKVDQIGDGGQIIVKLIGGGPKTDRVIQLEPTLSKRAIDFISTSQTITAADVRRDVAKAADLDKKMTVVVTEDTAAFNYYNENYGPIEQLPDAWYSLNIAKDNGLGGTYTVVLNPGEFAKQIMVTIPDATVLDPSTTYALAFTITAADADGHIAAEQKSLILTIGAKNKYDGVYNMKGIHNRPSYQYFYEAEMNMITIGASSVIYYWPDAGSVGHPIATDANNSLSWYGPTVAPAVDFDPATDLATDIYGTDAGGPPINKADGLNYPAAPDPLHPTISRFDAGTKTMYLYWKYNNNPARGFFDTLTYIGPR